MNNFVDRVKITAKAGNGGNGSASFHREKYVINGGPDGGDGGNGGDILVLADPNMHTLLDFRFRSKYTAQNGEDGKANRCTGKRGDNLLIKVPLGTVIYDDQSNRVIADMDRPDETKLLLKGGKGGWGNQHFATPTRQAPNFAKPGTKTEIRTLRLELKTIADVGLIGYPNVGKSSILSVVTSARPKIGNYHFTTITPNLGIVRRYGKDIVLADIPGLIDGAAQGAGLGHDFLRHIERTRLLLHVVDVSGSEGRDPVDDLKHINSELNQYGKLGSLPQIIVCNKTDLPGSTENLKRIKEFGNRTGCPVFVVSAVNHQGFEELMDETARTLETLPPVLHFDEEEFSEDQSHSDAIDVFIDDGVYIVAGSEIERLIESVNFSDLESLNWFHRTLRRLGIIGELKKAGAKEGSTVRIGDMEFDYIE